MTALARVRRSLRSSSALSLSALCFASFAWSGCDDPATYVPFPEFNGPAGVIEGTLTYSGPPPCTEKGHIVGVAVILAFDKRLLPPPEGLGTSAGSIDAVPGDTLFDSIRHKLVFDKDGKRRCPDAMAPNITASATWTIAPLPAGTYQIRGFYDRDANFDPAFSISNLPTAGDVGGGALDNAIEVALGKESPRFTEIDVGDRDPNGQLYIPPVGSRVLGVGVTLGQVLPLQRPVFYPAEVKDATAVANMDPRHVKMPSDFQLQSLGVSDASFIRIVFGAGVDPSEINAAAASPFGLPVKDPPPVLYMAVQDVNGDGTLDTNDHVPESALLPALYPIAVFSKLAGEQKLIGQTKPRVIIQGLTLYNTIIETAGKMPMDPMVPPFQSFEPKVTVAIRPAAICIDPLDVTKNGVLVVSHKEDAMGNPMVADEAAVKAGLQKQFGRPFDIAYGCMPEGQYALNLVYPTGQAWTVPNEGGICAPAEPMSSDGKNCIEGATARARLASQDAWLTIDPPKDKSYCQKNPTPAVCFPAN